jgi:hypothetical protein
VLNTSLVIFPRAKRGFIRLEVQVSEEQRVVSDLPEGIDALLV